MKKIFTLIAALTLSVGLWAENSVFTYTATEKLESQFAGLGTVATQPNDQDPLNQVLFEVEGGLVLTKNAGGRFAIPAKFFENAMPGMKIVFDIASIDDGDGYPVYGVAQVNYGDGSGITTLVPTDFLGWRIARGEAEIVLTQEIIDNILAKSKDFEDEGNPYSCKDAGVIVEGSDCKIYSVFLRKPAPYLFVDGIVTINELKDSETIYFQYFTYDDGKRVNGIWGDTNLNKSFEPYDTEGYCEINYTNKDDVERNFIVNPNITNAVDSIYQGETYLFADTLLTTAGTYNRMIGDIPATLTLSVKQNAPVVGDQFVDATSGLKFEVTSMEEPRTVKVIFNDYKGTSYTVPGTVTYWEKTFDVTEIGVEAFHDCSSLESITLPESVTTLANASLATSGLKSITIPATVTTIGEYAFSECLDLKSVTFLGNACQNAIGDNAFENVGKTTPATLTLPDDWAGSTPENSETPWYGGYFDYTAPAPTVDKTGITVNGRKYGFPVRLVKEVK